MPEYPRPGAFCLSLGLVMRAIIDNHDFISTDAAARKHFPHTGYGLADLILLVERRYDDRDHRLRPTAMTDWPKTFRVAGSARRETGTSHLSNRDICELTALSL